MGELFFVMEEIYICKSLEARVQLSKSYCNNFPAHKHIRAGSKGVISGFMVNVFINMVIG